MSDLAHRLRIKYGLEEPPSDELIRRWAEAVERLLRAEYEPEEAGRVAAKETFPDYERMFFKSAADTLEALLDEARKK